MVFSTALFPAGLLAALLCAAGPAPATEVAPCAATIESLRLVAGDPAFPLVWEETSMTDGKPLTVSILEQDGALFLQFVKSREGPWAEGAGRVCIGGGDLEARLTAIRLGTAAHWLLRQALGSSAVFALSRQGAGQLRISTRGWSGTFAPKRN